MSASLSRPLCGPPPPGVLPPQTSRPTPTAWNSSPEPGTAAPRPPSLEAQRGQGPSGSAARGAPAEARTCPASAVALGPASSTEQAHSASRAARGSAGPRDNSTERRRSLGLSPAVTANPPPRLPGTAPQVRQRRCATCGRPEEAVRSEEEEEEPAAGRWQSRPRFLPVGPGVPVHGPRAASRSRRRSYLCEVRVTASVRAGVTTHGGPEQPGRCSPRTVAARGCTARPDHRHRLRAPQPPSFLPPGGKKKMPFGPLS